MADSTVFYVPMTFLPGEVLQRTAAALPTYGGLFMTSKHVYECLKKNKKLLSVTQTAITSWQTVCKMHVDKIFNYVVITRFTFVTSFSFLFFCLGVPALC